MEVKPKCFSMRLTLLLVESTLQLVISTLASSEIMYALDASFTGRTRIKTCGPVSTLLLSAALVAHEVPSVVPVVWYLYSDSVSEYSEKLSSSDS